MNIKCGVDMGHRLGVRRKPQRFWRG